MATKEQLTQAIHTFIDNDMLPKAEGNYKIILGVAKAALRFKPDSVFEVIKNNSAVKMLGVIDEYDNIDMETLVKILSEGFGSEEFCFTFRVLGKEYAMHFSAGDIQTIKRYM